LTEEDIVFVMSRARLSGAGSNRVAADAKRAPSVCFVVADAAEQVSH
jgi:hypothetical protein